MDMFLTLQDCRVNLAKQCLVVVWQKMYFVFLTQLKSKVSVIKGMCSAKLTSNFGKEVCFVFLTQLDSKVIVVKQHVLLVSSTADLRSNCGNEVHVLWCCCCFYTAGLIIDYGVIMWSLFLILLSFRVSCKELFALCIWYNWVSLCLVQSCVCPCFVCWYYWTSQCAVQS